MADSSYTALVLAASRGNLDPLAQAGGVSPQMLHRHCRPADAAPGGRGGDGERPRVGRTIVAIEPDSMEEAKQILAPLPGAGRDRICRQPREYRRQRRRGRHARSCCR